MDKQRLLSKLALFGFLFALGVIALGAFTRLIDAGLGCPDWPGCYGHVVAPLNKAAQDVLNQLYPSTPFVAYKAWAEMVHRYFVGGLSLFILAIIFMIGWKKELRHKSNIILAICLFGALLYQILLGKWTVTMKLLPIVVTQHLLGGFAILAILWLLYLNNLKWSITPEANARKILPWAVIALILLLGQILLGAWTSTNYAALSCADFPFCNDNQTVAWNIREAFTFFPAVGVNYEGGVLTESARQTIQMVHRLGALVLSIYLVLFSIFAFIRLKHSVDLITSLHVVIGLLLIQVCVGISNVLFKLPLFGAVSHNLLAALLLISILTFIFKLVKAR